MHFGRFARIGAAMVSVLAVSFSAHAQEPAAPKKDGRISYRQNLMSSVGGDMGAIADILKYQLPWTAHAATHAASLHSHAQLVAAAFEPKVFEGPTDAMPEIWEKPDEWKQSIEKFVAETGKLADVAKTGDPAQIGPQVKATGKTCGSCHDSFRKPEEESYERGH
jgi:cytochrome c556